MRTSPGTHTEKEMALEEIDSHIRRIPDFPSKGIVFYDITTLVKNAEAFRKSVDMMAEILADKEITSLVAPESRGFIFASALSYKLGKELILTRKPGKLPSDTASASYDLEYGKDALEIHKDAINGKSKAVIVDDLLATGGTAHSAGRLVEELGGSVSGYLFLVELMGLKGAEALSPHPVWSLLKMPG